MDPFRKLHGLVAPLDRVDVDTDQIIPKQFLKRIERTGFGQFLFHDWRFRADGSANPEFELNDPRWAGATILLARRNFGCGSSREHAPWALKEFGFRVLIAPSFGDIFYNNCFKNGMLPIRLDDTVVDTLFRLAAERGPLWLDVDLESCTVSDSQGAIYSFEVDPFRRQCLLEGHDEIARTLEHADRIAAFEAAHPLEETVQGDTEHR
jgi:3-isopropylmalate/(R)-2-methylmalate dehydratase small subunit